jgi:hypothetical protein
MRFSEFRKKATIAFTVDRSRYVIEKLKDVPDFSDKVFSVIKDKNEVTVVAKEGVELNPLSEEKFFKLITFEVTLPFDLTGFLSHVSALLAKKSIPLLAFSAYSTDHILVREEDLDRAVEVLERDCMVQG